MTRKNEGRNYPNRAKKRTVKRKANRLANETKRNKVRENFKRLRADLNLIMVRGDEELVVGVRRGLFGHPRAPIYRITDDQIVGAVEDQKELGELCTKLGVMALSQLVGHNLAYGIDDLGKSVAKWARIDLEALKKASDAELLAQAAKPSTEASGGLTGVATDIEPLDDGELEGLGR